MGEQHSWSDQRAGISFLRALLGDRAKAVGAGLLHSIALLGRGDIVAWGSNQNGQVAVPAGLDGVIRIAVGQQHNLALRKDGTVVAWGSISMASRLFLRAHECESDRRRADPQPGAPKQRNRSGVGR